MLISVRRGVFETNSSSTHSLTMCSEDDYNKWRNGDLFLDTWRDEFVTKEKVYEKLELDDDMDEDDIIDAINDSDFDTYERFMNDDYLETFCQTYESKSGENIIAFGKYGMDN